MRTVEELREQGFTRIDLLAPQILPVKLKQIERGKHGALASAVAADQVKHRKPVLVANDCFAVE